jgi:hypothetical protein
MIETFSVQIYIPTPVEGFQWRSGYKREVFEELPVWLNRSEYQLHETGGNLHLFLPANGSGRGRTLIVQPGDFIILGPDDKPMAVREEVFRIWGHFVARVPMDLMDPNSVLETGVIVSAENA